MPPVVEKKARGKKKQKKMKKNDPKKLEILDACAALGAACKMVRDWDDVDVVTLGMLSSLGRSLRGNGEYEEATKVHERCLAGRMKVLREDHEDRLATLNNLGVVYDDLNNYEKALELNNIAIVYKCLKNYGKAEELYERALEGYEGPLGKDNKKTKDCAFNFKHCLKATGNEERLVALTTAYPWLNDDK
ncbi:hypothetical protein TrLO_g14505 [Triparma laevis f. longispina]|uniref:Tetratricopeptide repeat protein n=1 Tax=Triparma laevis f. longispina TaxID=1714387 RepID=A0A9W7A7Y5_9STRA|nr:hypothetical protein TrLO_g14505 [Triparma laevis f. longispina]